MTTEPDFRLLDDEIRAAMEQIQVPGVAVGLLLGDQMHTAGFGVTSVEHPLPVTPDTLFQVGSITKTVTGTAAMRLVEQGRLDLDAPIRTYLPDLRLEDETVAARVTLRHLFSHTGGWAGDYFDDLGPGDDALARMLDRLPTLPQLTPLGEIWSYNNAGFYVAGRVVEVVTGKPYEAAAKELVLDPLGMSMSFFFPADVITHRVAIGHENPPAEGYRPHVARPWALGRTGHPVGGLISTVVDQLHYARFHLGDGTAPDGTRLLRPETLAAMQEPRVRAANGEFLGLTWFVRDVDGARQVRHGGATNGQMATLRLVPARGFALVMLTNSDLGGNLYRDVAKWALAHYCGIHDPDPVPLAATEAQLAPYLGRYTAQASDLTLLTRDGTLWFEVIPKGGFPRAESPPPPAPPPVRATLLESDGLLILEEPMKAEQGEFLRDAEGRIAWLRIGGRIHRRIDAADA